MAPRLPFSHPTLNSPSRDGLAQIDAERRGRRERQAEGQTEMSDRICKRILSAAMIVATGFSVGGCVTADTLVTNAAIADMVEKGADPMAAACAVSNNSSFTTRDRSMRCAIVAAKGAK
jgi:hypothetical protein